MLRALTRPAQRSTRWLILVIALIAVSGASATLAQDPAATNVGESATAGPWQMTVAEVLTGGAAEDAAGGVNPALGNGLQYLAARIQVTNQSSQPFMVSPEDFAISGEKGIYRRSAGVFPPSPALDGIVQPGESLEGWILSSVEADAANLVLVYDSATITGAWADHAFALTDGASVPGSEERAAEIDRDGRDPGKPVGVGRVVSTGEWTVKIVDVVEGAAVNDISPEETQRLAQSYNSGDGSNASCLDTWVAIKIEATNNGGDGRARYLSATAFQLAGSEGETMLDIRMLTPPAPDLSGEYAAGASRTGWISFELPSLCGADGPNLLYNTNLLRFQPFAASDDVRYLTWGESDVEVEPTPTARAFDPDNVIPDGSTAITTDEGVRMREDPSVDAEIVDELPAGTEVEIAGPPEEGDGFTWYPVRNPDTDDEGWIVQDFLAEP
jgi:hypothetical protein